MPEISSVQTFDARHGPPGPLSHDASGTQKSKKPTIQRRDA
jgi:hypothetical protein